jgi:hypothetical protein
MVNDGAYASSLWLCMDNDKDFAGDLVLQSGLGLSQTVQIYGTLTSTRSVDLNGLDLAGLMRVVAGDSGSSITGRTVLSTGMLWVAEDSPYAEDPNSFSGTANFTSVAAGGVIRTQAGDLDGAINIAQNLNGQIALAPGDLLPGGKIFVGGDVIGNGGSTGLILVARDAAGDIEIGGDLTGTVVLQGELKSTGRILVDGLCDGSITVDGETETLSLIHLLEGIDDNGEIIINKDEGAYHANGTIHVGPTSWSTLPSIIFDGSIAVNDNGSGSGGDLKGDINVVGCHATADALDICIDGDGEENITITQLGCANQVVATCGG